MLHGLPLGQGRQVRDRGTGPFAEIALQQPVVVRHRQSRAGRRRLCRLAGALQRGGIEGVDGQAREPFRDPFRLGPAPVGQMQSGGAPWEHHARGRRFPVAHQKQERALPLG